jgi:hypothetical protein
MKEKGIRRTDEGKCKIKVKNQNGRKYRQKRCSIKEYNFLTGGGGGVFGPICRALH